MLFALGVERYATPGSWFAFHQTGFEGVAGERLSEREIRDKLEIIKAGDERTAAVIGERAGMEPSVIGEWQVKARTLTAIEAVAAGFAHAVRRPDIPQNALFRQVLPSFH